MLQSCTSNQQGDMGRNAKTPESSGTQNVSVSRVQFAFPACCVVKSTELVCIVSAKVLVGKA